MGVGLASPGGLLPSWKVLVTEGIMGVVPPLDGRSEPKEQAMVTNTRKKETKVIKVILLGFMGSPGE